MEDAKAVRSVLIKASSDAGPELASRESLCGDGKPVGPDRSLEKGVGGFKTLGTESQYIDDIPEGDHKQRAHLNKRTAWRAIFPRNGGPRGKYEVPEGDHKQKEPTLSCELFLFVVPTGLEPVTL